MASDKTPIVTVLSAAGKNSFDAAQVDALQRAGEATFHEVVAPLDAEQLACLLDGAVVAGLTPRAVPRMGSDAVAALPGSLRGIAAFATGLDFLDLVSLNARGITVMGLPDYSTTAVAEHTIGLLLTLSRRLHLSRDRVLGRVPPGTSVRGWELAGKRLGVVGLGRIGCRVAALAQAFGMRVLAHDPHGREAYGVTRCGLDELLATTDVVTLHASTSWRAGPLLGAVELAAMRPGAWLVNTARASLVDERAVVAAVGCRRLAGYALDDRLGEGVRPGADRLLREGRIVETGHTAWYANEAIARGVAAWVDNLVTLARRYAGDLATAAQ